jgi:RHS repeat-associated protein
MFAGVRFDIEIGLYYNRARYYNPYTGRFLQTDPIGYGDGMNMYAYCRNNTVNFVDPTGCVIIISPRPILPPDIPPAPTHGIRPWTIASGHPQVYQLCWQAMTGNGGDLTYTDSAACWTWAKADKWWYTELKKEMCDFVVAMFAYVRGQLYDPDANTINWEDWDYEYPLSGTYRTPLWENYVDHSISFGEPANTYLPSNPKWWIHHTQVEIEYSFTFSEDASSVVMEADFTLIDYMNLESEIYRIDKMIEWLFPYTPYNLYVELGTHTATFSMPESIFRFDGDPYP